MDGPTVSGDRSPNVRRGAGPPGPREVRREMEGETGAQGHSGRAFAGRVALAALCVAALMLILVTCVTQDPTAPEGSMFTVSANPQTVVSQGGLPGRTTVTATLRGKNGTRLPDQEVAFSTTSGVLTPA